MPKRGKNSNYQTPKREAARIAKENEIKRAKRNKIIKAVAVSATALILVVSIIVGIVGCNAGWFRPKDIKATHMATIIFGPYGDTENATVEIELYGEEAPDTVRNFIKIANDGDYDNSYFYRIIDGFVAQGVRPMDYEIEDKSYDSIRGEFKENGYDNRIKHEKGVISMARTSEYNSASYDFFIVLETSKNNTESLDGKYAAFGKVVRGMDFITKFSAGKNSDSVSSDDVPRVLRVFVETMDKYDERTQSV